MELIIVTSEKINEEHKNAYKKVLNYWFSQKLKLLGNGGFIYLTT